jgi:hypothetical protein
VCIPVDQPSLELCGARGRSIDRDGMRCWI